ncbi:MULTISPECIES: hypothetical protein [unclassified Microbacterium]|uniref:hypothetical protein n=1 Tax=unclassified Microbacterium TaxID=2609290 RepID=UPI00301668F3
MPWTSAIVLLAPGADVSVGVGVGVGSGPGSVALFFEFVGVIVAESEKSALFASVSAPWARFSDRTSVLPVGAPATAPSYVLDVP